MIFSHGLNIANQVLSSQAGLSQWISSSSSFAGVDLAVACAVTDQFEQQLASATVRWKELDTYVRQAEVSLDKHRFDDAQKSLAKAGEVMTKADLWTSLYQTTHKLNGRRGRPNEKNYETIARGVTLHWMAEFVRTSDTRIVLPQERPTPKTPLERLIMLFSLKDFWEIHAEKLLAQATEVFFNVTEVLSQSDFEILDTTFAAAMAELLEKGPEMDIPFPEERSEWAMALYKDLVVRHKYPLSKLVCFMREQDPEFARQLQAMIADLLWPKMGHPIFWEDREVGNFKALFSSLMYILQYDPAAVSSELLGIYKKFMVRWGMPKHLREQWRKGVRSLSL